MKLVKKNTLPQCVNQSNSWEKITGVTDHFLRRFVSKNKEKMAHRKLFNVSFPSASIISLCFSIIANERWDFSIGNDDDILSKKSIQISCKRYHATRSCYQIQKFATLRCFMPPIESRNFVVPYRCRASSDCPGYLVNYERESCFRVDFNTDDRRDDLIPSTSRVNYFEKVCLEGKVIHC